MTGRRIWIAIAAVVGAVLGLNFVVQGLDHAVGGNEPGGVSGSSYATASKGLAAFSSLLTHYGYGVSQQRGSIENLPRDATMFVLEPTALTGADSAALLQFVSAGGRLVIGGSSPFYFRSLRDTPPTWQFEGQGTWTDIDPGLGDLHAIYTAAVGSFSAPGTGQTLVGRAGAGLLTRDVVGRGEILFLADVSPLDNDLLGTADNAAFGLALAGPSPRVVFAEGVHGYGRNRGISALPDRWKLALILFAAAALAFVWSRARRFGPPDQNARDLPPARAEYVNALSISLERTRDHAGALAPAQRWARTRLATRAGLGPNANQEDLVRAARSFGCNAEEIAALLAPVSDDASVLALGRAVARVGGGYGDRRTQ